MGDEQHEKIEQRAYEIWEKIKQRAYEIWEREGLVHGDHERHWHTAKAEIEREISSSDILTVEALAMRAGISGQQEQDLIDRLGSDRAAVEEAARSLK